MCLVTALHVVVRLFCFKQQARAEADAFWKYMNFMVSYKIQKASVVPYFQNEVGLQLMFESFVNIVVDHSVLSVHVHVLYHSMLTSTHAFVQIMLETIFFFTITYHKSMDVRLIFSFQLQLFFLLQSNLKIWHGLKPNCNVMLIKIACSWIIVCLPKHPITSFLSGWTHNPKCCSILKPQPVSSSTIYPALNVWKSFLFHSF